MIPSDPAYGGTQPQIAKGRVDPGETPEISAIREGEEELGLRHSNIVGSPMLGWSGQLGGMQAKYTMMIYAVEVKDPKDFGQPHYETGWAGWIPAQEAMQKIRSNQKDILKAVLQKIM
jgi:8-oxo-dGTP pyrophosphatase MutT (NUDIX family)